MNGKGSKCVMRFAAVSLLGRSMINTTTARRYYFPLLIVVGSLMTGCGSLAPEIFTVGVVNLSSFGDPFVDGFKAGMAELGYVEGENVNYIYPGAVGTIEGLMPAIQSLMEADLDLILSLTTPATLVAKQATAGTDIPVIFVPVFDPVKSGIVESLTQPGGNLTGIRGGGLIPKQLEWLLAVAPGTTRIFVPHNPEDHASTQALEDLRGAAANLGVELVVSEVHSEDELNEVLDAIPEGVDAWFSLPSGFLSSHISKIVETAVQHRLPLTSMGSADGGLVSFGPDTYRMGEQASRMAAKILQGTPPADLPVETAEFFLGINLQTAQAIGLDITDDVLIQADDIIR